MFHFYSSRTNSRWSTWLFPGQRPSAVKRAGLISHLVLVTSVRFGGIEGLDELETRAARRRGVYSIGFEGAAIRHDDQRSRCHVAKNGSQTGSNPVRLNDAADRGG